MQESDAANSGVLLHDSSDARFIELDGDDAIDTANGSGAADLTYAGRATRVGHKVDGTRSGPAPVSLAVTSTPPLTDDAYGRTDPIVIRLTMDAAVTVTGTPHLIFNLGGEVRNADYDAARSNVNELAFVYEVAETDSDDDGIALLDGRDNASGDSAVVLEAGEAIRATAAGNAEADLVHPGRGRKSGHRVDGSREGGSNRPPTGASARVTATQDTDYAFTEADFGDGYSDPDGDALNSVKIETLPQAGALVYRGEELRRLDLDRTVVTRADLAVGRLVYRPPAGRTGDNFTPASISR